MPSTWEVKMRRVDKELKRVNRALKDLEECICMPICKELGVVPWNGNGCKSKVECGYLNNYFAKNPGKVGYLLAQRKGLEQQRIKCRMYAC